MSGRSWAYASRMDDYADISRVATLLAEPARAKMLAALISGRVLPAGELAFCANVSGTDSPFAFPERTRGLVVRADEGSTDLTLDFGDSFQTSGAQITSPVRLYNGVPLSPLLDGAWSASSGPTG